MFSVALIGPDGAGKTTLTRMLQQSDTLRIQSLYMGVAISSSNVALPTSRLAQWLKDRGIMAVAPAADMPPRTRVPERSGRFKSRVRSVARLSNRLFEEWYRQFVSWWYQLQGYIVVYDRHFVFDFAPEIMEAQRETLEQRIHRWVLTYCYPRPDLVLFLDAPGEVLYARKGELTVPELERRRQAFLRQGERLSSFIRLDATQPLAVVHAEIVSHLRRLQHRGRAGEAAATP